MGDEQKKKARQAGPAGAACAHNVCQNSGDEVQGVLVPLVVLQGAAQAGRNGVQLSQQRLKALHLQGGGAGRQEWGGGRS